MQRSQRRDKEDTQDWREQTKTYVLRVDIRTAAQAKFRDALVTVLRRQHEERVTEFILRVNRQQEGGVVKEIFNLLVLAVTAKTKELSDLLPLRILHISLVLHIRKLLLHAIPSATTTTILVRIASNLDSTAIRVVI